MTVIIKLFLNLSRNSLISRILGKLPTIGVALSRVSRGVIYKGDGR